MFWLEINSTWWNSNRSATMNMQSHMTITIICIFCSCLDSHRDLFPLSLFQNKLMIGLKLLHSRSKGKWQKAFEIYHQHSYSTKNSDQKLFSFLSNFPAISSGKRGAKNQRQGNKRHFPHATFLIFEFLLLYSVLEWDRQNVQNVECFLTCSFLWHFFCVNLIFYWHPWGVMG